MSEQLTIMIDARIATKQSEHGIARHVKELILNLFELNKDQKYFFYLLINEDSFFNDSKLPKNFKFILMKNEVFSLKSQLELFFILRKYKPNLFHSPHFIVPLLNNIPLIATIHDMNHLALGNNYSFIKRLYYQFFLRYKLQRAKAIITVSHFSKLEIIKYFKILANKIHVFYNGVNSSFKPLCCFSQHQISAVIKKYNLPERYIFALGNSKPHKNLAKVIESYALGNYSVPLLILSNSQEQITTLAKHFNCENKVISLCYVQEDDFPIIYGLSKLFIYISLYEGFGLPPLEAAACGIPTVVSNTTSLPEVMGKATFYVDPTNTSEIQKAIQSCLLEANPEVQDVVTNGLLLSKKYSWREMTKETLQLYHNLL